MLRLLLKFYIIIDAYIERQEMYFLNNFKDFE